MKTALLLVLSLTTSPLLAAPLKRTTESSAASADALTNALPGVVPVKREAEPQDLNSLLAPVTGLAGGGLKERDAKPQDLNSLLAPVTGLAGGGLKERDAEPQDLNSLLAPVTSLAGGGLKERDAKPEAEPQDLNSLLAPVTSLAGGGLKSRQTMEKRLPAPQVPSLPAPVAGLVGKVTGLLGGVV